MLRNKTNNAQKKPEFDVRSVRAMFVGRGDSLHAWSYRKGYNPVHVLRSIRGDYAGPKALRTLSDLRQEMGA